MKKALLLVCILSISVITTACINNLAVQELNNKAAVFMEKGNYAEAIERLKSSIDLDDTLFESHYNLAIAYTKNGEYANAVNSYRNAIKLKPDFADAYYSLAVAEEDIITDIFAGHIEADESGNVTPVKKEENEEAAQAEFTPSETSKAYADKLTDDAILNYETYLEKNPEAQDKSEVESRINEVIDICKTAAEKIGAEIEEEHSVLVKAFNTPDDTETVRYFKKVCDDLGMSGKTFPTFGGSDANTFAQHGIEGIVVSTGMNNCHAVNEYTTVNELVNASRLAFALMKN